MKNRVYLSLGILTGLILFASVCLASSWKPLANLSSGGEAKEVPVNHKISHVRVMVTEGTVVFNTIVVREGGKKSPHTIGREYSAKQHFVLDLPAPTQVTGLRISDGGNGRYSVHYK